MTAVAIETSAPAREDRGAWTRRLHLLLTAQSALLVLASINRLSSATDARLLPHGSLRVVDVVNLLVLVPATVIVFYVLLEHVAEGASARTRRLLRIGFVVSLYLYAASYGMHEPADFLHSHFCHGDENGSLCQVVGYQDDGFSHGLFFVGFAGIDAVLMLAQSAAGGARFAGRDRWLVLANASVVAAAIVANLGFEQIGLDLFVVAAVAALALVLLRRRGALPLIAYFAWAYTAGLALTLVVRAL
jgi:hypothetical protein